jgi:hypothetical protein
LAPCIALGCLPREKEITGGEQTAATSPNPLHEAVAGKQATSPQARSGEKTQDPETPDDVVDELLGAVFVDDFERAALGADWRATSKVWRIRDGKLCGQSARNHPVWLARRLPVNARIEFDATSFSPDGDLKAEFWGDGSSAASSTSYDDATSYLTIFGGWRNKLHVLARLDEHASDRLALHIQAGAEDVRARPVAPNQSYHFKVERSDGKRVRWFVDEVEIHSLNDPEPLAGEGHEHFGFNDWEVRVCFDNLRITPL